MSDFLPIVLVIGVLFTSTFIRSAIGFGDALLAMPLLALITDLKTAAPVVVGVSVTIGFIIVCKAWKDIQFKSAWRLVISSAAGVPFGIFFLRELPDSIIKIFLAIMIISFSIYKLRVDKAIVLKSDKASYVFGFLSGICGAAFSINGPPIIVYGTLKNWNPTSFRATLQGFFLIAGVVILAGYLASGLWTSRVLKIYFLALPVVCVSIYFGNKVHNRISKLNFDTYIYVLLLISGISLFVNNVSQVKSILMGS